MATIIQVPNMREGYLTIVNRVLAGDTVAPRGQTTVELRDVTIELLDPTDSVPVGVGRKLHLPIGAAETVQLIGGVSDALMLQSTASMFSRFTVDGRLPGAYGPRLFGQIEDVITRLTSDPDTRQAIAVVWRPDELEYADNPDVPCTLSISWLIRDGRLHQHTTMRSNDVTLGLPYDVMMFTRLQGALAFALGIGLGSYVHTAHSLHIYERDMAIIKELHEPEDTALVPMFAATIRPEDARPRETSNTLTRWRLVRSRAVGCVLIGGMLPGGRADWFHDRLVTHQSTDTNLCVVCRYVLPDVVMRANRAPRCDRCEGERNAEA